MLTPEHQFAAELGAAVETEKISDPRSAMAVETAPAFLETFICCSNRSLVVRLVIQVRLVHSFPMSIGVVKSSIRLDTQML